MNYLYNFIQYFFISRIWYRVNYMVFHGFFMTSAKALMFWCLHICQFICLQNRTQKVMDTFDEMAK